VSVCVCVFVCVCVCVCVRLNVCTFVVITQLGRSYFPEVLSFFFVNRYFLPEKNNLFGGSIPE
jgi:hypothetical protein